MKSIHAAHSFAESVQNGLPTNDAVSRLCCQHLNDIRESSERYSPFVFDESAAAAAVALLAPLNPSPAEQFFTWYSFGWRLKSDGSRRYANEAF
jgi:hypothetical protein